MINKTVETGQENYINSLLDQIELLKSELHKKDEQLNNTLRLLENSQILIRENKEKNFRIREPRAKERRSFFNWFRKIGWSGVNLLFFIGCRLWITLHRKMYRYNNNNLTYFNIF